MRYPAATTHRWSAWVAIVAVVTVLLTGCGSGDVEPAPTEQQAPPTSAPIATPGGVTVGDLIAGVDAAWPDVTSMRSTLTEEPVTGDTTRQNAPTGTVEEVVRPSSRRLLTLTAGTVTDEHVFVDGRVFMRGEFVAAAVAPEAGPALWITVDPGLVPPTSPLGQRLAYLTRPFDPPFAAVSAELRAQAASPAGSVAVGGRDCMAYAFRDATIAGEPIDYELAIDASGLPCQLTQRTGGFATTTIWAFNDPALRIAAPDAATPVAGTPEG